VPVDASARAEAASRTNDKAEASSRRGDAEAAAEWYARAVESGRVGDGVGRVDHESLGKSLHQHAWCHLEKGDICPPVHPRSKVILVGSNFK
jgi:hypothetical protein